MRDPDLDIARLTTQVGDLEAQLHHAKAALAATKAEVAAALELAARLGRAYGATRGLRADAWRCLSDRDISGVAVALGRADDIDQEWNADRERYCERRTPTTTSAAAPNTAAPAPAA